MNHDMDVEPLGKQLESKDIALLITGCIASYKAPSLIRHFRQYGANVYVYSTPDALEFVTEKALEWSSRNPVVTKLTSDSEHLREGLSAYVFAPATYDTIGKLANGVADNAVTTAFASALGRMEKAETEVLLAPAMHGSMENSIEKEGLEKLVAKGVKVISPIYKLGKANLADSHRIVVETIRAVSKSPLKGKKIMITAGPTPGKIDDIRYITNRFKGTLGVMIADEAYMRGADVQLIMGPGAAVPPKYINTIHVKDFEQYRSAVLDQLQKREYDVGIFSAAVADYIPEQVAEGKIPSGGAIKSIALKQTPKVIAEVRGKYPGLYMVTFKYEVGKSKEELLEIGRDRIARGYNMAVANRGEDMLNGKHLSYILDSNGVIAESTTKGENAFAILDALEERLLN